MNGLETAKEWSPAETRLFYEKLLQKALESISESGAAMILGPMFILRSPEENFRMFESAKQKLEYSGTEVFDQLPYLDYTLGRGNAPFDYKTKFEVFYKQLISSGKIKACYLLPDWEKSEGTRSEVEYCKAANVPVFEIKNIESANTNSLDDHAEKPLFSTPDKISISGL